jgi:hypothetical protein
MELKDPKLYYEWKSKNTDTYGWQVFQYVEAWIEKMESLVHQGTPVVDAAEKTKFSVNINISGFQFGCACSIIAQCWRYQNEFTIWWKKQNYF